MSEISLDKSIALIEEFETSHKLLQLGFGELQNINMGNDFYFLPFQLLSLGFERLFKAYICVGYFQCNYKLPNHKALMNLGHDLIKLFDEIMEKYYIKYTPPIFEEDWDFIYSKKSLIREIINILSDFGQQARYYNFNLITSNPKLGKNPKERWSNLESRIKPLDSKQISRLLNPDTADEIYPEINRVIISNCERLLICLGRQISFGTLGLLGKQLASSLYDYATWKEDKIGIQDYRKSTIKFNQTGIVKHKRSIRDYFCRRFNPNYKYKSITKRQYNGDWPFYTNKVVVERRGKHWCVVTINGNDYALNGAAKGRYNLPTPYEGGMSIPGKSIEDFIQIALNL